MNFMVSNSHLPGSYITIRKYNIEEYHTITYQVSVKTLNLNIFPESVISRGLLVSVKIPSEMMEFLFDQYSQRFSAPGETE